VLGINRAADHRAQRLSLGFERDRAEPLEALALRLAFQVARRRREIDFFYNDAYCYDGVTVNSIDFTFEGRDVNNPNGPPTTKTVSLPCIPSGIASGPYGSADYCKTAVADAPVVIAKTEILDIIAVLRTSDLVDAVFGPPTAKSGRFPLNDNRAVYPKISPPYYNGEVPFPGPPYRYCPESIQGSTSDCPARDTRVFRAATIAYYLSNGMTPPPGITPDKGNDYDTHHIVPLACGGPNLGANGVFLDPVVHRKFNTWWRTFAPCTASQSSIAPIPLND
jgi:hypothetical protein